MPNVDLFAEDQAHDLFVLALLRRIFGEAGVAVSLNVRSAVGGHGRAVAALRTYQRAVLRGAAGLSRPDLLVVMIDANCKGLVEARNSIAGEITRGAAGEAMVTCPAPTSSAGSSLTRRRLPVWWALTNSPAGGSASVIRTKRC